jgi:single-strand DNA-binding protein
MVGSINKVTLLGNLGADPTVSVLPSGSKIVNLRVATSDSWKDKATGERKERTEWHRVVIFNPQLADTAERYLRKGSKVYLEGSLQTRQWKDNNGNDRYTTEIVLQNFSGVLVLLDSRNGDVAMTGPDDGGDVFATSAAGWDNSAATAPAADLDDDIPF